MSKKKRKPTLKKQLRDAQRLAERMGLPSEIKEKKDQEIKSLKKNLKRQKEAQRFELKYKKIKFIEKRKVIRKLDQTNSLVEAAERQGDQKSIATLLAERDKLKNDLLYINHYPVMQKYLSLFPPSGETPESRKLREETYAKILKTIKIKQEIRDKELLQADVQMQDDLKDNQRIVAEDAFFALASDSEEAQPKERRVVMRDGRVPMLAKNFEKI